MKSKKKFLSLLVFAPLLVGCGNNVSKPRFAKYSNEVATYDKFYEELQKELKKSSLQKPVKEKVGSLEFKSEYRSLDTSEDIRDKKSIYKSSSTLIDKGSAQYDAKSLIFILKDEMSSIEEITDNKGTQLSSRIDKFNRQYQTNDNSKGTSIDLDRKEYEDLSYESYKPAEYFDYTAKSNFYKVLSEQLQEVLSHYSVDDKDDFKFYKDGNVFTVVEEFEEKDESEKSKYESKVSFIAQVDITEGNWSAKYYSEFISTTTYKQNSSARAKGDVVVDKEYESCIVTAKARDLKLKKLDLSKLSKAPAVE